MNNHLLFLSFGLLSWAWLLNNWLAAAVLLPIIWIAKLSPWRWQITLNQFYRWGDLSSLLVVLLLAYLYLFQTSSRPVFILLKWLPLLFSPVLLAQLFSSSQKLPLGALFYSFRKYQAVENKELDFQPHYIALCLLSAGAANVKNLSYFVLAVVLFVGLLWTIRPKHGSVWAWLLIIGIAVPVSHLGQFGLRRLQNIIEYKSIQWLGNWTADPFKAQTSIGELGEMKLFDKIAFRVKAQEPMYLLQASYDRYMGKHWIVSSYTFSDENPVKASPKDAVQKLEILQQFPRREAMLALPDGTVKITGMEGADFEYNALGAVKITNSPDLGHYQVFYTGRRTDVPTENDLKIPKQHTGWVKKLTEQLKLAQLNPQSVVNSITSYFQHNFYYSLYLGAEEADADLAIKNFMLQTKAGHCEYFAVATVFLLRQAGIPARFANGYAVEEYDPQQDLFIVRYRHAHAWAIAYINGMWQIVDSTPSQWLKMENEHASLFQPLDDWFSNLLFNFKQWQIKQAEQQDTFLLWAAGIMTLYISWRIYSARRQLTRQTKKVQDESENITYQGLDSEFYLIMQQLQGTQYAKDNHESVQEWVTRLQIPELTRLYRLHYQLRFDPVGVLPEQRTLLRQQVSSWIENNNIADNRKTRVK
jgi:hypothetical protein